MRHLSAADYKRTKWKNGGGETTELMVFPDDATLDDFIWRVSTATITDDAEFSLFPGIDRSLAVIDGEGIILHLHGGELKVRSGEAPIGFPGDALVSAALLGGSTTDFNVMTRRDMARHQVWLVTAGDTIRGGHGLSAIFVPAAMTARISGTDTSLASRDLLTLDSDETAHIEHGRGIAISIVLL